MSSNHEPPEEKPESTSSSDSDLTSVSQLDSVSEQSTEIEATLPDSKQLNTETKTGTISKLLNDEKSDCSEISDKVKEKLMPVPESSYRDSSSTSLGNIQFTTKRPRKVEPSIISSPEILNTSMNVETARYSQLESNNTTTQTTKPTATYATSISKLSSAQNSTPNIKNKPLARLFSEYNDAHEGEQSRFVENYKTMIQLHYKMFDLDYIESKATFMGTLIPSTMLTKHFTNLYEQKVTKIKLIPSPLFIDYEEDYDINFENIDKRFNPMLEIGKIIEYTYLIFLPERFKSNFERNIITPLNLSYDNLNKEDFIRIVSLHNETLRKIPRKEILSQLKNIKSIPQSFIHDFLQCVYSRIVTPRANDLKHYEAFSNNVYGELLPKFLSDVFMQCNLNSNSIFIDLGSGVGNCVVQAALEYGCKLSFGCEIMKNASTLTELQQVELENRCKLFGIRLQAIDFSLRTSFVNNEKVSTLLKKCDVVLVNNFLFDSDLNKQVENTLKDLKIGCKVISLKNLRPSGYTIDFFNIESILNRLKIEQFKLNEDCVSWTHKGGEYYISTVLEDFDETLFDPSRRHRKTRRPSKYSR
ncbi:hypothetical protein TBLA_0D01440 [Henningerozyma blattae CBS 6284]|uniref:Histone-lysine N-methyltransferase, H3 lysine-79 specific n=1 Tax=Henningerozyma blattae (strain ATCC 34711 / CBS 6284 / DSM 70876 / NBRC 10599 / NRRL Y-10934 / UCD 77-7) TaxID=1071380 RepID=I2H2P9_HENB6|nr:hypothetical protein TBLA_0D01440 [Tetrapisispora blattae CBS 6284]CCH60651.1 hypothetical protein TBLA_0D01440 [Tetrapisispora blattae CBS 6284]